MNFPTEGTFRLFFKDAPYPNWRTRLQPIRTASEIQVKIVIEPLQRTPLYQKLAKKVEELSLLGISLRAIARTLKISKETATNAYRYSRQKFG